MFVDLSTKTNIIEYRVITEDILKNIIDLFAEIHKGMTKDLPDCPLGILFVIRAGDVIYTGPSVKDFYNMFMTNKKADYIQILLRALPQKDQLPTRQITLTLDKKNDSSLMVQGVDQTWVKGTFELFNDIFKNELRRNVILHNIYFEMAVQLLGAFSLTVFSIYAANKISTLTSFTAFQYSSVYLFAVIFIIFSNIWTYVVKTLNHVRKQYYPKVDIRKEPRKQFLVPVVSFFLTGTTIWCLNYFLDLMFKSTP